MEAKLNTKPQSKSKLTEDPATVAARPSIVKSSRWIFAGSIVSKPVQFLSNVLLARILGPVDLGLLALTNSAAITLSGIAGFGLGDATNKSLAEHFRRDNKKGAALASFLIWLSITLSTFIFVGLWFTRKFWSTFIFSSSVPNSIIGAGLVLGWSNLIGGLCNNALSGLQLFRDMTIYSFTQTLATLLLAVTLGMLWGTTGAIAGYILASVIFGASVVIRLWSFCPAFLAWPRWPCEEDWLVILAIASPMWLWALLSGPLLTLCFAYIGSQPNGAHELGIFNTANALKMTIALLPALLGNVINPAIIEEGGKRGNPEELAKLLKRSYLALGFMILPALLLMAFASDLLFLVYGNKYAAGARCFIPLAASAGLLSFSIPAQYAMVAKNKAWWNLIAGAFQQVLLYTFVRMWGESSLALGLSWAFFFSQALFLVVHFEIAVFSKAVPASFRRLNYGFLAAIAFSTAAAWFLPNLWRWCLSAPLSVTCAVVLIRRHAELTIWINSCLPLAARPWWTRFANMAAGGM